MSALGHADMVSGSQRPLARFLSPALHQKLVDDSRCRIFEMLRQRLPVLGQLCIIEYAFGDNLVANGIDEREEMRAAIIAKWRRFDRHLCLDIPDASDV